MPRRELCDNDYDRTFLVTTAAGAEHTFDSFECASFECAVQVLAPTRERCGCKIIGHGIEGARKDGAEAAVDHA